MLLRTWKPVYTQFSLCIVHVAMVSDFFSPNILFGNFSTREVEHIVQRTRRHLTQGHQLSATSCHLCFVYTYFSETFEGKLPAF